MSWSRPAASRRSEDEQERVVETVQSYTMSTVAFCGICTSHRLPMFVPNGTQTLESQRDPLIEAVMDPSQVDDDMASDHHDARSAPPPA